MLNLIIFIFEISINLRLSNFSLIDKHSTYRLQTRIFKKICYGKIFYIIFVVIVVFKTHYKWSITLND